MMHYDEISIDDKFDVIMEWGELPENRWYDLSFVDSLYHFFYTKGFLTPAQEGALDKIIIRFNIIDEINNTDMHY